MRVLQWLLCVVSLVQCVTSQITLEENGPGIVKPGESLDLVCKVTGASLTDSTNMYGVSWIRQDYRKQLLWLGTIYHNGNKDHASSLQGRLTLTRDTNKGEVYCKITGLKPEESGTYHCARRYGGGYFDIWGKGTFVTVTSTEPSAPSLFPLISCGTSEGPGVIVGCLAKNFLPDSIEISWTDKVNNSFATDLKKYNSMLQSGGTYITSSQVTVPSNSWDNNDPYYCVAKHTQDTKRVELQKPQSAKMPPIVTMHPPIREDLENYGNSTIVCHMSGFRPANIEVSWLMDNQPMNPTDVKTEDAVSDGNGHFMRTSFATVLRGNWDTVKTYSCRVRHIASGFSETRNLSKSNICEPQSTPGGIIVSVLPPSFETLYVEKKAPLTCLVFNMIIREGLKISWYDAEDKEIPTTMADPIYNDNGTYSCKATATVCPEDWNNRKIYECRVSHSDLATPKKVQLVKPNGESITPSVYVFPPHQDELAKKSGATLSCLVKNFYPKDIFVKWLYSNGSIIQEDKIMTTEPIKENNPSGKETYFTYSTLFLSNTEKWNSGESYSCMVGHESLPLQAMQRSIDKTSGKPTNVNVSLVMSDTCS